jgi:hypothetical protein
MQPWCIALAGIETCHEAAIAPLRFPFVVATMVESLPQILPSLRLVNLETNSEEQNRPRRLF